MDKVKTKKQNASATENTGLSEERLKQVISQINLLPSACAATAIKELSNPVRRNDGSVTQTDYGTLVEELRIQNQCVSEGDLSRVEAMLLDQAHVLQAMFTNFTKKMANAEYITQLEAYSRISLKAQNQCRQTLATLGELKNPKRATFIKQQNNAVNQQINQDGKQVENQKNSDDSSNELLEVLPSEWLDTGTPQEAVSTDQEMETLEEGHRSQNTRGEA